MDGEFGQPANPSLGTDRFPRPKKSQRPQGFGLDRSLQQQRTPWNHRDRNSPRRDRFAGAILCEGALHASPKQAGADQPGEARSFRHVHAGNRFGNSEELRSGRTLAEAIKQKEAAAAAPHVEPVAEPPQNEGGGGGVAGIVKAQLPRVREDIRVTPAEATYNSPVVLL